MEKISQFTRFLTTSGLLATLCFSGTATADSDGSSSYGGDKESPMNAALVALEREDYQSAINELLTLISEDGESADALNLLGFSNRKMKIYDEAYDYYIRALAMEPDHLGANEYLGELYVETEQMDKAQQQLDRIYDICQSDCDEYLKLKKVVEAAQ